MAAQVMREGRVQAVITGADRIAANGDTANKIGTYSLAVLARAHQIPFYVASPCNTFDLSLDSGGEIPIEQRAGRGDYLRAWAGSSRRPESTFTTRPLTSRPRPTSRPSLPNAAWSRR